MKVRSMIPPREVVDKHNYYMGLAFLTSSRSKDPNTQAGAVIVSADNTPVSSGYNGVPSAIDDNLVDWSRPNKYTYIHHAEDNAIWHADKKLLKRATMYVTMHPCKHCMLDIVRSGIYNVIYFNKTVATMLDDKEINASKKVAEDGKVSLIEFDGNLNWIRDFVENLKDKNIFN